MSERTSFHDPFQKPGRSLVSWIGRWAGDVIAVVGDYVRFGDLPKSIHTSEDEHIYAAATKFENITPLVRPSVEQILGVEFVQDDGGWWSVRSSRKQKQTNRMRLTRAVEALERIAHMAGKGTVSREDLDRMRKIAEGAIEESVKPTPIAPRSKKKSENSR